MIRKHFRKMGLGMAALLLVGVFAAACGAPTTPAPTSAPVIVKETVQVPVKETVQVQVKETVQVPVKETVQVQVTVQAPAAEPNGELIFWGHDQHPIDLAAQGFVQRYPKIKWNSPHPADWPAKLQAALAAGEGCPDLVWLEASQVNDLARAGALVDITQEVKPVQGNYHPIKVAEASYDGKFYGWPGNVSLGGWYYRQDLLKEAGYGEVDFSKWTWDDFNAMSKKLAADGKYTFAFPGKAWPAFYMYVLHQTGGSPTDETGAQVTLDTPEAIRAMEIVKAAYESGGGLDVEWWSPAYWAALQDGTLVGDFAADWAKGFWEGQIKDSAQGAGQWRIAPFPAGDGVEHRTGVWGGATLAIPVCAKNKENALAMMKYAFGTLEGAGLVSTWGIIPSYRPYLESPLFIAQRSGLFGNWAHNEFWAKQEPELSAEFYRRAGFDPISNAVGQVMPSIMEGEVTIEEGLAKIEELAQPDVDRLNDK
jgi:multiple sugar transport system substrate-binding protein